MPAGGDPRGLLQAIVLSFDILLACARRQTIV